MKPTCRGAVGSSRARFAGAGVMAALVPGAVVKGVAARVAGGVATGVAAQGVIRATDALGATTPLSFRTMVG